jgi:hypothetical protein
MSKRLRGDDVLGLRAFLALYDVERYALTFGEGSETVAFDLLEVCEYVGTAVACDETETFSFVEPFNRASCLCHVCIYL